MEPAFPSDHDSTERPWWWMVDPRQSLRARAALLFGGGTALFAVLLGAIAAGILHRHLESQLSTSFETLAFQVGDKIDRALFERYQELQFTSRLAPFRTATLAPLDRRHVLETLQDTTTDFAWIGFADPAGRVTTGTRGLFEGGSVAERTWFRSAQKGPYAGPPHEFPELARTASDREEEPPRYFDLATPATADNGQFLGVIGAHLRSAWLREIQLSVIPETARRSLLGVSVYSATGELILDSGGSGWTQPPESPQIPGTRRFRGAFIEPTGGGTTYVTGYARSRGYEGFRGLGWITTVRQPVDRAFASVRELQLSIFRWGFSFVGVVVVASWFLAGRLVRRMRSVEASATKIRLGDILALMPRPGNQSEFARMCAALGSMVDDFRRKQEKLETANDVHESRRLENSKRTAAAAAPSEKR